MATIRLLPVSTTYSTLAAAYAASSGANNILQLESDVAESLTISKDIAEIRGDGNRTRTWSGTGASAHCIIATGLNRQLKIKDLIMDHDANAGEVINITGLSASGSVYLENNKITRTAAVSGDQVLINYTFTQADSLVVDKCLFTGSNRNLKAIKNNNAQSVNGAIRIQNSIFYKMNQSGNGGISAVVACTNTPFYIYNNTFAYLTNIGHAIDLNDTRVIVENNVFAENGDDVNIAGTSTGADFTYNAFQEQGSPFGSNNIFSIVTATEFVAGGTGDLHLNSGAQCRNAGTTIAVVTDDYDGVARPSGSAYDIGAYEYYEAPAGSATNGLMMMGVGN